MQTERSVTLQKRGKKKKERDRNGGKFVRESDGRKERGEEAKG